MIKINCSNCNKEYERQKFTPSELKRNKNNFCCRKCYDIFQNKMIKVECNTCHNKFNKSRSQIKISNRHFCSKKCFNTKPLNHIKINCQECNKKLFIQPYKLNKKGLKFCSKSCKGSFYTRNKQFGINRSKFELWLESKLPIKYPKMEFLFNERKTIGYELDIFIPNLKIAFEINGITHYKPIFGEKRFERTKQIDKIKIYECKNKNISLYIINVSKIKFSEKSNQKYYSLISKILESSQGK